MSVAQSSGPPRVPAERVLIVKILLALGLALLLVVGAWSDSHGEADAHSALCLAPGVSSPVDDSAVSAATPDLAMPAADAGLAAMLCCFLLVLLFLRLLRPGRLGLIERAVRMLAPPRAGPVAPLTAPDLIRLSISRT